MKSKILVSLLCTFAFSVHAEPGANMHDKDLSLRGQGVVSYLVFEVYEAQLYLPPQVMDAAILQKETPRRLSLRYMRDIKRSDIELAAMKTLENQWPAEVLNSQKNQLNQLHAAMRDVKENDIYTLDYRPGKGLSLSLNDKPVWQGGDARLAEMYFGIWLGDEALSPELKLALLGKSAE
ncbi:MAG: chalcone isomerase family protein [Halothiobacillaceae bacterium]